MTGYYDEDSDGYIELSPCTRIPGKSVYVCSCRLYEPKLLVAVSCGTTVIGYYSLLVLEVKSNENKPGTYEVCESVVLKGNGITCWSTASMSKVKKPPDSIPDIIPTAKTQIIPPNLDIELKTE
jgi:hypothetical protein